MKFLKKNKIATILGVGVLGALLGIIDSIINHAESFAKLGLLGKSGFIIVVLIVVYLVFIFMIFPIIKHIRKK